MLFQDMTTVILHTIINKKVVGKKVYYVMGSGELDCCVHILGLVWFVFS